MRVRAVTAPEAGLLASAVALRWSRPDLTAALAEHVGETSAGDHRTWVAAAGWLVHGRAAIGDGRECASDALAELARRGPGLLDDPAADRLRIEVAALATGQREPATARLLVAPLLEADRSAEVRADALGVFARCVMEERPAAIGEATRRAEVAWSEIGSRQAEIAVAAVALLSAAAFRRSGHPDSAAARAAEGLARLDGLRAVEEGAPSRHLAAALGAEWITALIEAGRKDDAGKACLSMAQQLEETARPTRQIALLRLAVARALAESSSVGAVEALEQAARDAACCDTPDLEGLCLSTLGALREQSGRLDAALESMRRGVAAQRRDRARSERFRAALGAMSLGSPPARARTVARPLARHERTAANVAVKPTPSSAVTSERNLVEPVHPLAGGGEVDPWSTGRWAGNATAPAPGAAAVESGGRRRRRSPAQTKPEEPAADVSGVPVGADDGLSGAGLTPNAAKPARPGAPADAPQPVSDRGGIGDIPVVHDELSSAAAYDGERWLEAALAELDRVLGRPLPALDGPFDLSAEPAVALSTDEAAAEDRAVDRGPAGSESAAGSAVGPADGRIAVGPLGRAAVGPADGRAAIGPDAVGCVVVVDVVRAGSPVPDVGEVLREVADRLTLRIPAGARLRNEADESALSVVLPGRAAPTATDWMHQTLPAVFADMADLGVSARWATGTTLRAAVHDTDGPVGAQLLQRLDVVAVRPPVPPARHDVGPTAVVRWGVPIFEGSGGRRRRPDDVAGADAETFASGPAANSGPAASPTACLPGPARPVADKSDTAQPAFHELVDDETAIDEAAIDEAAIDQAATGEDRIDEAAADQADDDVLELGEGRPGIGLAYWDSAPNWLTAPRRQDRPASNSPGRHRGAPDPEAGRSEGRSEHAAIEQDLGTSAPELGSAQRQPDVVPTTDDDPAFSVEGLGLADLLAGALAAYRGI